MLVTTGPDQLESRANEQQVNGTIQTVLAAAHALRATHMLANVAGVMDHFLPVSEVDDDT